MQNFITNVKWQEKQVYLRFIQRTGGIKQLWNTLEELNVHRKIKMKSLFP